MTRRRWMADEVSENTAALIGDHADHLVRVLRAQVGQEFDIATGTSVRRGRITLLRPDRVEFELAEEIPAAVSVRLNLFLAIFKFDRMEWAIEKCTELGVSSITPLIAQRTDSHLASASIKRVQRWQRIAHQASEQSRRSSSPEIAAPVKPSEALDRATGLRIVLAESERQTFLRDIIEPKHASEGVTLSIGPEGGWTEAELQSFQRSGWISASLGKTILRAETAAIAATTLALSALNSL
jgi:16S rRNA (uracil1498-N3)-methyltransferase